MEGCYHEWAPGKRGKAPLKTKATAHCTLCTLDFNATGPFRWFRIRKDPCEPIWDAVCERLIPRVHFLHHYYSAHKDEIC